MSVDAQESISVYNRNEEVSLPHGIFMYNEKSFIHIEDLSHLGLEVIEEDKQYTITSSVALGVERKLVIKIGYSLEFITTGDDDIIIFKANWSF